MKVFIESTEVKREMLGVGQTPGQSHQSVNGRVRHREVGNELCSFIFTGILFI